MTSTHVFSRGIVISLIIVVSSLHTIPRTLPHTLVFFNTSDVEQVVWISSEYTLTELETQTGSDVIRRPIAPNKTFVYGGKQYNFDRLEVRLNPSLEVAFFTPLGGSTVSGLAASVSIVTIFDGGEYTVRNKGSFSYKLWKAGLRTQAAQKAVKEKFHKAGNWVRKKWHATQKNVSRMFHRADEVKEQAEERLEGKEDTKDVLENISQQLGYAKETAMEKTKETLERMGEMKERAKEAMHEGKERIKDALESTSQEIAETKERVKRGWRTGEQKVSESHNDDTQGQ